MPGDLTNEKGINIMRENEQMLLRLGATVTSQLFTTGGSLNYSMFPLSPAAYLFPIRLTSK